MPSRGRFLSSPQSFASLVERVGSLFFKLARRADVFPLFSRSRIPQVFPAFFGKRLRFADVGFEVEQRDADLAFRVFTRLPILARRFGTVVIVRQVQLPFAAPDGL